MPKAKVTAINGGWQDINDDIANSAVVVIGSDEDPIVPKDEGGDKE